MADTTSDSEATGTASGTTASELSSEVIDDDADANGGAHGADEDGVVDEHGIPVSIKHSNQNPFTVVWSFVHKLAKPIPDRLEPGRPFTHICLVCADKCMNEDTTSNGWKGCLMRQQTSTNAARHMRRKHKKHPFSVETSTARTSNVLGRIKNHDASSSATPNANSTTKKQRTLHETIIVRPDEVRIMSTRWLLSSGLPYTVLQNEELQHMLRRLSNQPSLAVPDRETIYEFAGGDFAQFVELVSRILKEEFGRAHQQPFLAVLHDLWTNAANMSIIGVTIIFIDWKWRLRTFALLANPNTLGHGAEAVSGLIKANVQSRYDVNIDLYSRFTVSDTTGSARNVSDHFSNTDQVDCLMHLLSLCILYALGLKENTRDNGGIVVTPGGAFQEGLLVIQKLRELTTYFSTPLRLAKLKQVKEMHNLPAVNTQIDSKTRVGYAVTLMRRSVYNHHAFMRYFETVPALEQTVWSSITADDWNLIIEMEAITDQLAQFSLGEVQKVGVASSYALLFRKMLSMSLELEYMECLVLEKPTVTGDEFTQRRVTTKVSAFSSGGKRCRDRLREQWALRFPQADTNDIKAMLLDPRIKSKAAVVVSDDAALARAETELQCEYEVVFRLMNERDLVSSEPKAPDLESTRTCRHGIPRANSAMDALLDVDVPTENEEMQAVHDDLLLQARNSWNQWKALAVKWPCVAKGGKYNVLQLYREVDILEWFRDHGQTEFPAVAALARIYLGKPVSTATQERFFSLSSYVVNDLRTRLDENRAEMMCLMKANWSEYKALQKE